jgi:hypothetical protein
MVTLSLLIQQGAVPPAERLRFRMLRALCRLVVLCQKQTYKTTYFACGTGVELLTQ